VLVLLAFLYSLIYKLKHYVLVYMLLVINKGCRKRRNSILSTFKNSRESNNILLLFSLWLQMSAHFISFVYKSVAIWISLYLYFVIFFGHLLPDWLNTETKQLESRSASRRTKRKWNHGIVFSRYFPER